MKNVRCAGSQYSKTFALLIFPTEIMNYLVFLASIVGIAIAVKLPFAPNYFSQFYYSDSSCSTLVQNPGDIHGYLDLDGYGLLGVNVPFGTACHERL